MKRDSSSPADGDFLGQINFIAENDASQEVTYAQITGRTVDVTDGTEDGRIAIKTMRNGSSRSALDFNTGETVFNDDGDDVDFRVETDDETHALFIKGSSGKVGLGTSSPDAELHIEPAEGGSNASIVLADNGRSVYYRIQNNDTNDTLTFNKSDATQIMQITGVNVGIFSTAQSARLNIESNLSSYTTVALKNNNSNNTGVYIAFQNSSNQVIGSVSQNGTATSFNTSSDYRLKENVIYDFNATTRLKQLKPCRFNFIEEKQTVDGFLAHEVSDIVPEAITGTKDDIQNIGTVKDKDGNIIDTNISEAQYAEGKKETVDSDGNKKESLYLSTHTWEKTKSENVYQQIDQAKLVPLLVKTIQELEARITALESA